MENILDAVSLVLVFLACFFGHTLCGFCVEYYWFSNGHNRESTSQEQAGNGGMILSGIGLLITLINLKVNLLDILLKKYFQY